MAKFSRSAVALYVVLAVAVLAWPTTRFLVRSWAPEPDNIVGHGWLLVAVACWALWHEAKQAECVEARFGPPLAVTLMVGGLWALADASSIAALAAMLLPVLVGCGLWLIFGTSQVRRFLRPLIILGLATPVWEQVQPILWKLSVVVTQAFVRAAGIPAFFDGNRISIPSGTIEIAAGCAGTAFFAVAVAMAAIVGYLNRVSWPRFLLLVAVAALLGVISNWLRIAIIVFEAHRTQMRTTLIAEGHYTFGWLLFAAFLLVFVVLSGRLGGAPRPDVKPRGALSEGSSPWVATRVALATVALALGPAWVLIAAWNADRFPGPTLPVAGESATATWAPEYRGATSTTMAAVTVEGRKNYVFAAHYKFQRQGGELIGEGSELLPARDWAIVDSVVGADHRTVVARHRNDEYWIVRYQYASGTYRGASDRISQLVFGLHALTMTPGAGIVALGTRCDGRCAATDSRLDVLWQLESDRYARLAGGQS